MEQKRPIPTERLRTIRGQMVECFSLDELRDLTFDLGADWEQLPGSNKSAKTTELLELLNRRTQLPHLLARLEALRTNDGWALDDLDESAEPPYKGLAYFDAADAGLFFGRERLSASAGRTSPDGTARVWDAVTGEELFTLAGDGTAVNDARWNGDESRILIATGGGQVIVYYTRMDDLIAAACARLGRNLTWFEWQQYFSGEPYRQTCLDLPVHYTVPEEARP
ncbi:MAG: hypothetical protein KBG73_17030 [Candidatus Promineofilum sp.]|jgi:hypothetical protein|nr:hypothetical protein [Promineifilum sp.]